MFNLSGQDPPYQRPESLETVGSPESLADSPTPGSLLIVGFVVVVTSLPVFFLASLGVGALVIVWALLDPLTASTAFPGYHFGGALPFTLLGVGLFTAQAAPATILCCGLSRWFSVLTAAWAGARAVRAARSFLIALAVGLLSSTLNLAGILFSPIPVGRHVFTPEPTGTYPPFALAIALGLSAGVACEITQEIVSGLSAENAWGVLSRSGAKSVIKGIWIGSSVGMATGFLCGLLDVSSLIGFANTLGLLSYALASYGSTATLHGALLGFACGIGSALRQSSSQLPRV